jgi:two-component system cell cycle response regulator DivK
VIANILVAEDNALNFELVRDVLVGGGHRIGWARNGQSALTELRREPWDLLLLDLHMPDLDGYQVLETIRADPAIAGVKVVVLSADAMHGVAERVRQAGADGYIAKPLDIRALLDEVARLLQ